VHLWKCRTVFFLLFILVRAFIISSPDILTLCRNSVFYILFMLLLQYKNNQLIFYYFWIFAGILWIGLWIYMLQVCQRSFLFLPFFCEWNYFYFSQPVDSQICCQLEWSGEVRSITYSSDGKSVSVVYRVTIYGTDAEVLLSL